MSSETSVDQGVDRTPSAVSPRVSLRSLAGCWLFTTAFALSASAAVHLDVSFQENESDGRLSIHGLDFGQLPGQRIVPHKRVFGRTWLLNGFLLVQSNPGFAASDNETDNDPHGLDPPAPNTEVYFNVLAAPSLLTELGGRNLSYWDGNGAVSWGPVPGSEGIQIESSATVLIQVHGETADVPGFLIDVTDNEGGAHRHLDFMLLPPGGPHADGVYLMMLEAAPGFKEEGDTSEYAVPEPWAEPYAEWVPFFVLFEGYAGGSTTVDAAIADIEADLLKPLCSDGIDNDRDGLIDAAEDPGCVDGNDMSERGAANECDNGIDDDIPPDGFTDYPNDLGCDDAFDVTELPEPGSTAALLAGGVLVTYLGRRRRRA